MKYGELRRLAEAATPGPWWHAKSISYRAVATLHRNERPELIPGEGAAGEATAAYIAAASPDVILALLDERERYRTAFLSVMRESGDDVSGIDHPDQLVQPSIEEAALEAVRDLQSRYAECLAEPVR